MQMVCFVVLYIDPWLGRLPIYYIYDQKLFLHQSVAVYSAGVSSFNHRQLLFTSTTLHVSILCAFLSTNVIKLSTHLQQNTKCNVFGLIDFLLQCLMNSEQTRKTGTGTWRKLVPNLYILSYTYQRMILMSVQIIINYGYDRLWLRVIHFYIFKNYLHIIT